MQHIEETIRKAIARNLGLISGDLQLIQEEYPLNNCFGTKGSIDILARDTEGHFVIIEVKRSNQTAREALHEISKYAALIKQKFHVRDSELRIILISTVWTELIVPYSDFLRYSDYHIEGFEISLDTNNEPICARIVSPVDAPFERRFSISHLSLLYETEDSAKRNIEPLVNHLVEIGLCDHVIFHISGSGPFVVTPHALYIACQYYPIQRYLDMVSKTVAEDEFEEMIAYEQETESAEEYAMYLMDHLYSTITKSCESDSVEIGYPEKLYGMFYQQGWKVEQIVRGGFYASDPRLTDEQLVADATGTSGINHVRYYSQCSSKYRARVSEIMSDISSSLDCNPSWHAHIQAILNSAINSGRQFNLTISIYNPNTILQSIAMSARHNTSDYFPSYQLLLNYHDQEQTDYFEGIITWDGTNRSLHELIHNIYSDDENSFFMSHIMGGMHTDDDKIMEFLGLSYATIKCNICCGKDNWYDLVFRNGVMTPQVPVSKHGLSEYVTQGPNIVRELVEYYINNMQGF